MNLEQGNITHNWKNLRMNFIREMILQNVCYLEIAMFVQKDIVPNLFEINAYTINGWII